MIIEALMVVALAYYRTWEVGVILLVLIAFRRAPWFARAIADMLDLDQTSGMTLWIARVGLPAWDDARFVMSRSEGVPEENDRVAVVELVPSSLVPPAKTHLDRDISREGWIVRMAEARDENGDYIFSANQIDKAIGAHRATTLEKIRAVRANTPPAQFKQEDGTTAPASHPITS